LYSFPQGWRVEGVEAMSALPACLPAWLQVEKTTRNALDVLDLIGLHHIGVRQQQQQQQMTSGSSQQAC
jgi:hypothetical protein